MESKETSKGKCRKARLSAITHVLVVALLATSFVSGVLIWWGQTAGALENEFTMMVQAPSWVQPLIVFHGCLFPLQCGLFGYLVRAHFKPGWELGANRVSGLAMDFVFVMMILSGVGLYYVGEGRETVVWVHRISGASVPVFLGLHWYFGHQWAKKL